MGESKQQQICRRLLARHSIETFCRVVLKDPKGNGLTLCELHRSWHAHIDHCWEVARRHPVILAPWGHGKTVQIALGRVLFELGREPSLRVKLVCNSRMTARHRIGALANYVQYDEDLHAVFAHLQKPPKGSGWTRLQFTIGDVESRRAIDPSVQGDGVLSTGIGGRADLIVFDDVVDRRNAIDNPNLQQKVVDNFFETWLSRLDGESGRTVTIMTLWHRDDLGHRLMANPEFCVLKQGISDDLREIECELTGHDARHPLLQKPMETMGGKVVARLPLWEARWPREALLKKKNENPRSFARGFQQRAFSDEERMFPSFARCLKDATLEELFNAAA